MNIITVKINGVEYNLKGEEQEDYLHKVARHVDRKIQSILDNNPKLSTSSAAILTAMNAVDERLKEQEKTLQLEKQLEKAEFEKQEQENSIASLKNSLNNEKKIRKSLEEKIDNVDLDDSVKEKEEQIKKMSVEMKLMQDTARKYMEDNNLRKAEMKDLKFQLQSAKYKIMDMEKKLLDSQVNLAREKKQRNALKVNNL
ncbi:cell division protein ZapA [Clostridium oceanicum]|uniref:Cell division protein ZapA n=1 Tax=Clostridium oceanicum TaxID=1543 RepID=A0ABN1JWE7_9CLOT